MRRPHLTKNLLKSTKIPGVRDKQARVSVIAVLPDRTKACVKRFLESIPEAHKKRVKSVCTDMFDGYVNAAIEVFGIQALVIDRYHVAKLYRKPLDNLRIKEMARLKKALSDSEYGKLEGMMWILRRQHECLTEADKNKLEMLYMHSPRLKKAHRYALRLTHIFNTHCSRKSAMAKINRWRLPIEKNEIKCFFSFIKTLKKKPTLYC